jgi:peptidoglycan/xylan/chitin deacetylase (PgdA/CDA1 family)
MLPIKRVIAIVVFVSSMVTGWVAPELVLPATAPDAPPPIVVAEPSGPPPPPPQEPVPEPPVNVGKVCYLTFDDGPDGIYTTAILDILKQYDVKATFFVLGSRVNAYPAVTRRMLAEGHVIGNHTYSHNYANNSNLTAFLRELELTNAALEKATGQRTSLARVPGGSATGNFRANVQPYLSDYGYEYYDWNVDSEDALRRQTPAEEADHVVSHVVKHKTAMVLMHSIKSTTMKALPSIIERLQAKGYTFRVIGSDTPTFHFSG